VDGAFAGNTGFRAFASFGQKICKSRFAEMLERDYKQTVAGLNKKRLHWFDGFGGNLFGPPTDSQFLM
jgi:hypothetical protein